MRRRCRRPNLRWVNVPLRESAVKMFRTGGKCLKGHLKPESAVDRLHTAMNNESDRDSLSSCRNVLSMCIWLYKMGSEGRGGR